MVLLPGLDRAASPGLARRQGRCRDSETRGPASDTGSCHLFVTVIWHPLALGGDSMTGFADLVVVDLECTDPPALAEFYHQILGWDIVLSQPEYIEISNGTIRILFTRRDGYQGRGWPEPTAAPKRYHLCLQVDDVADAVQRGLDMGGGKSEFQPGGDRWAVLTAPSGHPFCLARAE